jgi:alpha-L-fucosidase
VTGEYENYTTPEQEVPNEPLSFPWETCMTMGDSWSYVPNDNYKSSHKLIQLLVKIVSRGGNFLLNIGPGPDGDWDPVAYSRLQDIGKWIAVNGEGIYNSKPMAPYSTDNIYYTQAKGGETIYAFYLSESDVVSIPNQVVLKNVAVAKGSTISLLGTMAKLKWKTEGSNTIITIPSSIAGKVTSQHVAAFKIQKK